MAPAVVVWEVDPFDLPEWLGTSDVSWRAQGRVRDQDRVTGELRGGGESLDCDLLAADSAFPEPVLDEDQRRAAHQAWTHGQVTLLRYDGRLTLAVPGTRFTADLVLECLSRLAKAVGVRTERFTATLHL